MSKTTFFFDIKSSLFCFWSKLFHSILELYSLKDVQKHHLFRYQNDAASILPKTMLSSISEKVKTGNVSIVNDLSRYRKDLLIFVMYIYLFQPELLNFN